MHHQQPPTFCCTLFCRRNRSNTIFYANDLMATNFRNTVHTSSLDDSNFLTRMLYKNINRFDDICWHFLFNFISHIHCLVAVCQPLIKLLLIYLLTYLTYDSGQPVARGPTENHSAMHRRHLEAFRGIFVPMLVSDDRVCVHFCLRSSWNFSKFGGKLEVTG